jgi:hypothetical protein
MPSLVVRFRVNSQPSGANLELRSKGSSAIKVQNTTDVDLTNIYRGLYDLDVRDNLNKQAHLQLNLVDAPPATVDCVLVPISDPRISRCQARE